MTLLVKRLRKKDETRAHNSYLLATIVIDTLLEIVHIELADLVFHHRYILVSTGMSSRPALYPLLDRTCLRLRIGLNLCGNRIGIVGIFVQIDSSILCLDCCLAGYVVGKF